METLVTSSKDLAMRGMEVFLKTFSCVPDEKLTWSPAPTAKSPIRIAAHTALYAGRFASMITERKLPEPKNLQQWLSKVNAEEEAVTSRSDIERFFRNNTNEVIRALDTLTAEDIDIILDTGLGWTVPMVFLMNLPGLHAMAHASQIDYLQTCWGDQEVHI